MRYSSRMAPSEYQDLVAFLGERFETIDRRFDAMDQRFEAIDRRFDAMDQRFEAIDHRFDAMDQRFEAIDHRFDAIDRRFEAIDHRSDAIGHRFEAMDRRFDAIDHRFDELRAEILDHFDELYQRLERLEQEYVAITQALRRIEAVLLDEGARRERLEQDLASLREDLAVLRARVDDIERRLSAS